MRWNFERSTLIILLVSDSEVTTGERRDVSPLIYTFSHAEDQGIYIPRSP